MMKADSALDDRLSPHQANQLRLCICLQACTIHTFHRNFLLLSLKNDSYFIIPPSVKAEPTQALQSSPAAQVPKAVYHDSCCNTTAHGRTESLDLTHCVTRPLQQLIF